MFDFIKTIFADAETPINAEDDTQVALGALLVEAARRDDDYADSERDMITAILAAEYGLSDAESVALRERAEAKQAAAVGLHRFAQTIREHVAFDERVGIIERLWQVILADGVRDADEDALMRKLCGLIGVPDRDSGLARARVERGL